MKTSIVLLTSLLILTTCATSPTGRKKVAVVSESEMNKMGIETFEQIKEKETISTNKEANDYVQCIAKNITRNVSESVHAGSWEVVVFESEQINAFALPGGKIGVYTGLMKVAENQHQLAAVMGHEVAHVIAEHSNERVSSNMLAKSGLTVLDLALGVAGVENKDLVVQGAGLGVQYGLLLPYNREHESEADIIGQDLMAKSGFKPQGSVDLWLNMAKASKGSPPELLSTHPSHDTRIKDLKRHLKLSTPLYQAAKQKPACQKPASI